MLLRQPFIFVLGALNQSKSMLSEIKGVIIVKNIHPGVRGGAGARGRRATKRRNAAHSKGFASSWAGVSSVGAEDTERVDRGVFRRYATLLVGGERS